MKIRKWLSALLVLSLLLTVVPTAFTEADDIVSAPVDAPVDDVSIELGSEGAQTDPIEETGTEPAEEAPEEEGPFDEEPTEETEDPIAGFDLSDDDIEADAALPAVKSAKLKAATIKAGASAAFTVKTDKGAKYLHLLSSSGKLLKRWKAAGNSKVSGKVRIWTVKYKVEKGGKYKYNVKASLNGRKTGKGKSVSLTVLPGVKSAKAAKAKINAGAKAKFTVKTDSGAKYLHVYSGSKQVGRYGASKYAKLSSDKKTLTWTISRKISKSGAKKFKFKASLDKKKTGASKSAKVTVLAKVSSAKVKSSTIKAGAKAKFTVKTDTGAKYLFMYNESGKKMKTWEKAKFAKLSSDGKSLVWSVSAKFAKGGVYKRSFRASANKTLVGIGKSVTVKVKPKVVKVKASAKKIKKGNKVKFTVTTDKSAHYLYMYVGGKKVKAWGLNASKVKSGYRVWTVKYKFTSAGTKKCTFKAANKDKKPGAGKSLKITVTSDPVKYRALLIGQEDFSPVCHRNRGDVNLMKEMLGTVKGPAGGSYAITTKFNRSKQQVLSDIKTTFKYANANDVSLFFIATHGDVSCSQYLYPEYAGCLSMLPETNYFEDQLTMRELATALKNVPGKVIVILESCGSGAAIYSSTDTENSPQQQLKACAAFDQAAIDAFSQADPGILVDEKGEVIELEEGEDISKIGDFRVENKFYVLTASRFQEESYGREDGDSSFNFFTIWFVMGIVTSDDLDADYDHNGTITLKEAFKFVDYCGTRFGNDVQHVQVYPKNSSYALFKRK